MVGGGEEGRPSTNYFPPVGGQVGAGGLLLGVSSWAAELVQHGLIPEGRAERRRSGCCQDRLGSLTPRHFYP